jgi:hypothetical protein
VVFNFLVKDLTIDVKPVLDTDPPVIESVYINSVKYTQNMVLRGDVLVEVNVSDENLARVEYSFDNITFNLMELDNTSNLYRKKLHSTEFTEEEILFIKATDQASNFVLDKYIFTINNSGLLPDVDLLSFKISKSINLMDGLVDPIWEEYPKLPIPEYGSTGYVQSFHDETYVYFLLAYENDITWVSIEFSVSDESTSFMNENNDAWTFGSGEFDYFGDGYMRGSTTYPENDEQKDVFFNKIEMEGNSLIYIEVMRLMDTGDVSGRDIVFNHDSTVNLVFASNIHHTDEHKKYSFTFTDLNPSNIQASEENTEQGGTILSVKEISDFVFVSSFVIVIVTVFIHGALRVVSKPIKHEKRVIRTDRLPNQPGSKELIKKFLFQRKKEKKTN